MSEQSDEEYNSDPDKSEEEEDITNKLVEYTWPDGTVELIYEEQGYVETIPPDWRERHRAEALASDVLTPEQEEDKKMKELYDHMFEEAFGPEKVIFSLCFLLGSIILYWQHGDIRNLPQNHVLFKMECAKEIMTLKKMTMWVSFVENVVTLQYLERNWHLNAPDRTTDTCNIVAFALIESNWLLIDFNST